MRPWIRALTLMLASIVALPSVASIFSIGGAYGPSAPIAPSSTAIYTGADGVLAPASDYTLPYRADGLFDFTAIDLGAGITLRFDPQMTDVTLHSRGDIQIAGVIEAAGIKLALETSGQILVSGSITADSISLTAIAATALLQGTSLEFGAGTSSGNLCQMACMPLALLHPFVQLPQPVLVQLFPSGDITLQPQGGISLTVPEPATPWLIAAMAPLLMRAGRKRI